MTGENRVLAFLDLQVINSNPGRGIKAIIHQIKTKILPMLFLSLHPNKRAGRIKHGNHAVNC
jgi:hypothetical protein